MRFAVVCALLTAIPTFGLQLTSPSPTNFWVSGTQNVAAWTTSSGDPELVAITITNPQNATLNGAFAIAQDVAVQNRSFTFTNVTLRVADGYVLNLVNTSNLTQVFASSQPFSVKSSGTTPPNLASITAPGAAATPSSTSPASNSNSSANSTGSSTSAGSSKSPSSSTSASRRTLDSSFTPVLSILVMTTLMTFFGAFITL